MKDVVYQVSAHEYTPKQAAEEFARKWFSEPRRVEWFADNRFALVDGISEYEVIRVPEVYLVSGPLWQIVRLLTKRAPDGFCTCPYSQYPLKDGKCPNCGLPKTTRR